MRDSMAQQKGHAPWLGTKTTVIDKGWRKGEDQRRFHRIGLEGQTRNLHAD